MDMVWNQATELAMLADVRAGRLITPKVGLFQNDVTPTSGTPLGDYTEADYTGYAKELVTWLDPVINDEGQAELIGIVGEFRPTASTVGNSIYGAFVTDTTGAILHAAARFDAPPLPMVATTDNIVVTLRVRVTPSGLVVTVS